MELKLVKGKRKKPCDVPVPRRIELRMKIPTQLDEDVPEREDRVPEYSLLASVIHRALLDLISTEPGVAAAAYNWCKDTKEQKGDGFSFVFCCEALGLCPKMLLKQVKMLRRFTLAPECPTNPESTKLFHIRLQSHSRRTI